MQKKKKKSINSIDYSLDPIAQSCCILLRALSYFIIKYYNMVLCANSSAVFK